MAATHRFSVQFRARSYLGSVRLGRGNRLENDWVLQLRGFDSPASLHMLENLELYESESRLAKGVRLQNVLMGVQIPPGSPKPSSRGKTRALRNRGGVVYRAVLLRRAD
jgi:hypothetical protein